MKIGPEAQTEVVASRIVWALGYHQVPSYFVERWIAVDKAKGSMLGGARFRPHELGLKSLGEWSWQQNPFVGTPPYKGLLVLMMVLNSTDLKNENNTRYDVDRRAARGRHGSGTWSRISARRSARRAGWIRAADTSTASSASGSSSASTTVACGSGSAAGIRS